MLFQKKIDKNYVKIIFVTSIYLIYFALNIFSVLTDSEANNNEISFTRYQHNCKTTVSDLEEEKKRIGSTKTIHYSAYELNLGKDPRQALCIGKVISIEVDNQNINASIGTSYWLFKLSTLIFLYALFSDKKRIYKFLYLLNIIFIKFWLSQDTTFPEYAYEVLPILIFCIALEGLKNLELKNVIDKESYMQKIDSFRAVAVIVVILNHFNKDFLPNGYLGVDIFFVLSGFVITKSLLSREHDSFKTFYKSFLIKRFRRIYPVLIFVILLFLVLINFYDPRTNNTFLTGLTSLFAFSNIFLYTQSIQYFSDISSYNSFLHTWSLGVEEQFYLIFPVFYFLFIRNKKLFKVFLIFFISVSIYFFINEYTQNFSSAYYLPQYRFWEIALGSLTALFSGYKSNLLQNINFIFLIILLFSNIENNALLHVGIVFLTALFILLYDSKTFFDKPLNNNTVSKIGLLSYSLYLIHLPVSIMFKWYDVNLDLFYYLTVILGFSLFTYKYIEIPNRLELKISKQKIIFICTVIISLIVLNPLEEDKFESKTLKNESFIGTFRQISCHTPRLIDDLSECFSKDKNPSNINIYLLGDSHISNHFTPIKNILPSREYIVELFVDFGYINFLTKGGTTCENLSCLEDGTNKINTFLAENLDKNDILVISMARDRYVSGLTIPRKAEMGGVTVLESALIQIIEDTILPSNSVLYLVDDIPKPCLGKDEKGKDINWVRDIVQFGNNKLCFTSSQLSKQDRIPLTNLYIDLADRYLDNVKYIDPHDYLCWNNICNVIENDILLYADFSPHLTMDANIYLESFWSEILHENITK